MRSVVLAVTLCGLICNLGFAQVKPTSSLQPTPLEAFAGRPTAHVTWSEQVGRIESTDVRAVITAVVIEDPANSPHRMRGVRIDLENAAASDQLYLEESKLAAVKSALDEIASGIKEHRKDQDPTPYRYYGAAEFWRPNELVHTLNAAYYIAPDSSGLSLSARKKQEFKFPDHSPAELAEAIGRAIATLQGR